ncbi:MAG: YqaA family protein [Terriglobales bacterium]
MRLIFLATFASAQNTVWQWLHRLGGPGLVLLGILDSSVVPLPGSMDVFTVVLSAHHRSWWPYYGFMATFGTVLGGYLTYRLAEKGGEQTLEKKIGRQRAEKVYNKFEKQGGLWVFVGSILPPPFPIVPFLMAAGVLKYPKKKFLAVLAGGRGIRFFSDACVAHLYGGLIVNWVARSRRPLLYVAIGLGVAAGLVALVFFKWYLPRKKRQAEAAKHRSPATAKAA